eukprot:TRINITY_DN12671_c0_g1_i1.p1 TRINITY_DN12671_c0_g1~~TRINITY_DN12671_c0_g1_i1.p1  ORF type:complete len:390 (-),score=78.34 TRINITY_DN12671_c0_g1_i1:61-1176(-)
MAIQAEASGERLFVTKIPPQASQEDVAAHFSQFGTTTDVYLPAARDRQGHKGIAFISFGEPAAAQLAISNGPHIMGGQEVVVDIAAPRGEKVAPSFVAAGGAGQHAAASAPNGGADRLFVTKVPPQMNREHLERHFVQFGELTDVYMPAVPGSGTHKGIAFISFTDSRAAQLALQQPSHEIDGIPIVVDAAAPRGAPSQGKGGFGNQAYGAPAYGGKGGWGGNGGGGGGGNYPSYPPPPLANGGGAVPGRLFLTKVPQEVTKADLEAYFLQYGELDDVFVPGNGKGIAFVSLKDASLVHHVLQQKEHFVKAGVSVLVDQAMDRPGTGGKGGKDRKGGKGGFDFARQQQPAYGGYGGGYHQAAYGKGNFGPY